MKNLKKLASLLLVLVMVFALAAPAMATEVTITIDKKDGAIDGDVYTAYKIFDATVNGETSGANNPDETPVGIVGHFKNVSYTINKSSPFYNTIQNFTVKNPDGTPSTNKAFALTSINGTDTYVVEMINSYDAADLADALKAVITDSTPVAATGTSKLRLTNNNGYYLILSSLGSKAVVDTIGQTNMTITAKNDLPTLTKKITGVTNGALIAADANGAADKATASYGSVVTYTVTVNVPLSANDAITVHDLLDTTYLTYGEVKEVNAVAADGEKTPLTPETFNAATHKATEGPDSELVCNYEYVIEKNVVEANLGKDIEIVYTATVNNGVATDATMSNKAFLTYSNYTGPEDEVTVITYQFDLVKTTSNNNDEGAHKLLPGAEFQLYTNADNTTPLRFSVDGDVYSVDPTGDADTIVVTNGKVTIKGLSGATYYLKETKAPEGYNAIDDAQEINLTGNNGATTQNVTKPGENEAYVKWVSGGVQVINLTGAELPSTGGIGTTLFYIVGGLLIVGAAVLLITKKRVSGEQ